MAAENPQLNLDSRKHGNVEDCAILCEPRVRPSAVVADSRRRVTVDDPNRLLQIIHTGPLLRIQFDLHLRAHLLRALRIPAEASIYAD